MSDRLDRVLAVLDGTGQHSYEGGHGHDAPGWCARCQASEPAEGGDLCAGCRAFLLGDTDVDPRRPWAEANAAPAVRNGDYRDNRPENLALVRPHWQPAVEDAEAAMDRARGGPTARARSLTERARSAAAETAEATATRLTAFLERRRARR